MRIEKNEHTTAGFRVSEDVRPCEPQAIAEVPPLAEPLEVPEPTSLASVLTPPTQDAAVMTRAVDSFKANDLTDPLSIAAAQTVNELLRKRGDESITKRHLRAVGKMLTKHGAGKKTPIQRLNHIEVASLKVRLPVLEQTAFREPAGTPIFTQFLFADAVADEVTRTCAEHLGACYENGRWKVTLEDVVKVKDTLGELANHAPLTYPDIAKKILAHPEVITHAALDALTFYMRTGKGGLTNWGPAQLTHNRFDMVFQLAIDTAPTVKVAEAEKKELGSAPSDVSEKQKAKADKKAKKAARAKTTEGAEDTAHERPALEPHRISALSKAISEYEARFGEIGFDRIYMLGDDDGKLYMAVNPVGSVGHVSEGDRADLGGTRESPKQSAFILYSGPESKSFVEATVGVFKNSIAAFGTYFGVTIAAGESKSLHKSITEIAKNVREHKSRDHNMAAQASVFGAMALFSTPLVYAAEKYAHASIWVAAPLIIPAVATTIGAVKFATKPTQDLSKVLSSFCNPIHKGPITFH